MKRSLAIFFSCLSVLVSGQNLVQNPSFEHLPDWDDLWYLSMEKPSTRTAVFTRITSDAHEGSTCVELSNTDDGKWTYLFTDVESAPLSFKANRSYEIVGWIKSMEEGKEAEISIFWDDADESEEIYKDTPDPLSNPDWFRVRGTITVDRDYNDGFLSLGFKSDKDDDDQVIGKLLVDDFSVTLIPDGTDTDIWSFSLPEQISPGIIDHDLGTISFEVPYGTDVSALVPDNVVLSSGASISPAAGEAQDFASPVIYTVTAENGNDTRQWTVTVTIVPLNTATDISSFHLPELIAPAIINGNFHFVSASVSYGTDLNALIPSIGISRGASIDPAPGTPTDFSAPVIYTVTAEDGITSQDWVVVLLVEPNSASDITSFEIPELLAPAIIDNSMHTVMATVRYGTDLRSLVPDIGVSAGALIYPESGVNTDFSSPVIYTITAEDGTTTQDWTVSVVEGPPSHETDITAFEIPEMVGPATIHSSVHLITCSVPYGTDLTAIIPIIAVSDGAAIHPVPGAVTDFSSPVTYTITAEDGTTSEEWLVNIQTLPNYETDITGFSLPEQSGYLRIIYVNHTIDIEVIFGTDVSSLAPTISLSPGATINPPSGVSRDFTHSVDYMVTAEDGVTVQEWTVTVIVEQFNTEANITSFHIPELSLPATIDASLHKVEGSVPSGTVLEELIPTISVSNGASIHPESGTATDFSSPVTYTVTAEDGITVQDWLVSIGLDPATGSAKLFSESLLIYPNPATDFLFIELKGLSHIRLYDPMGRLCFAEDNVNGKKTLHVSEFEKGIYILKFYMEDGHVLQNKVILR